MTISNASMKNLFLKSLYTFIIVEILSLLSFFYFPNIPIFFFIIVIMAAIASLYKLEYGLYILLAELFIGGKGYLFSLNVYGFPISIRMGIFFIIFAIWMARKFPISNFQFPKKFLIPNSQFLILFLFIVYGILNGLFRNAFGNVFFDANAWIFFLLIFVFLDTIKKENIQNILTILFASVVWIGIKTAYVIFLFSRNFSFIGDPFYKWIRDTGVGEITSMGAGMYRIFFQSHIYSLIAAAIILSLFFLGQRPDKKSSLIAIIAFYFSTLSILISQSRSFWVGGVGACIALICYALLIQKIQYKKILIFTLLFIVIIYSQLSIIKIITGNFGNFFSARLANSEEEAAGSSRLNQIKPLFDGIKKHPIFGSGFGTKLAYKSNDPRVLKNNPDGMYTTYAFEWGYLDIWLKIGLVGLGIYLTILFFTSKQLLLNSNIIQKSLFFGLLALAVTNIFSPYLNHPLGIGYILLVSSLVYNEDMKKQ